MTPQTAKTKIEALLNTGVLKGVKVEYEDGFTQILTKSPAIETLIVAHDGNYSIVIHSDTAFHNIKTITPIPLEPKLLEVGTRVKIIGGEHEGKNGKIEEYTVDGIWYSIIIDDGVGRSGAAVYHVIPESLLVEEEEKVEFVNANLPLNTPIILERKGENIGYKLVKE